MGNKHFLFPNNKQTLTASLHDAHNPFLFLIYDHANVFERRRRRAWRQKVGNICRATWNEINLPAPTTLGPSTPKGPKGTRCTHFCGLLLRHATKLLWGLVNLRTLRMSTKKKSQIIALNGATPAAAKRENRLSSRNPPNALTTPFVGLLSHYIMMIIFIAASRDIFLMSPPSAQMAYNGAEETETPPKRVSVWVFVCVYVRGA